MKQRDSYDGSDAPFQGNVVLRLRSIPVNARILKVTATVTPVSDKGGPEPFTELIDVSGPTGDLGTTKSNPGSWVEVDFHARRTLAKVEGSHLGRAGLQVDFGGGAYVAINQVGGFKAAPTDDDFPMPGATADSLPALTVNKLKLTPAPTSPPGATPDLTTVVIRSVPSNVSLRIGDLAPFWTHAGEMPLPETTPDFAALLQNFLAKAKVENGVYIVPLTLHSDTLARMRIDLDIEQVSQTTAIPSGLKEVVQPFGFSSLPQPQADVLQVEVPMNSRVVSELTTAKVKGGFAPTRVVLGPTGPVSPAATVEVSPTSTPAEPFTVTEATGITGIDLLITCADPTVSLQADIRADLAGKPDNPPLFRGPVDLSLEKKSAGESQAFWASVALPSEFHLEAKTYWLVLQSLTGNAAWNVATAEANAKAVMQRSQDGGFSWRQATAQPQPSASAVVSGPLSALFRLRRKPDQYQVPIDLLVGKPPTATRVKLDRFAPLGRVDFAPSLEVSDGFNQYLQNVAQQSPAGCPQGEQLANGDFEQWCVLASTGTLHPVNFGAVGGVNGVSAAVAADGKFTYVGIASDGVPFVEVIDVLCDELVPGSEIDLHNFGNPFVLVSPNGPRLYAVVNENGNGTNTIHLVDLTREKPEEFGVPIDLTKFTEGLPAGIVLSPDRGRIYFAAQASIASPPTSPAASAELLAFSTASLEQAARGLGLDQLQPLDRMQITGQPTALAISADGTRLYVAVSGKSHQEIWVVDANAISSGALQTINLTLKPTALALTPDGTHAVVVGPQTGTATAPGTASIVDLASQLTTDVAIENTPTAVAVSPDGKRAFVAGSTDSTGGFTTGTGTTPTGNVTVVDLSRARTVQTFDLDGVPVALAINPQGDRVYVAKNTDQGTGNSTPIDIISLGTRVPADWMLTAGSVKPDCLTGDLHVVALLGHVQGTGEPVPPANGLSQVIPAASCTYDFSFWGLSNQDGAVGEVLWLGQSGGLLRADQLPIEVWKQPPASSAPSASPSPAPSPTPSPAPDPEVSFETALAGPQPPVLHRQRLIAPDGVAQAEVRFSVPSGGLAAIGMVSLAGASDAVTNTDLRILQNGVPVGWTLTPQGVGVSVSPTEGGVVIQNGSAAPVELVQTSSLKATQNFILDFLGGSVRQPQSQENPSIELRWLKNDGTPAGPATVFEIQPQDFGHVAGGDSVPKGTTQAEVHLVVPAGTSLTVSQLTVQFVQTTTVPVTFIAQSPGELTVSDLRVAYENVTPPNPPVPDGGLASPTPPGQEPGEPSGQCYCPCCGEDANVVGSSSVKTSAGWPATVGNCITCGTTLVRLGGRLMAGAPQISLPVLSGARQVRAVSGPRVHARRTLLPKTQPPLTAIPGIGKVREQQLKKFGIHSIRELAAARPQVVAAALTGVSLENAPHFINEARRLLEAVGW